MPGRVDPIYANEGLGLRLRVRVRVRFRVTVRVRVKGNIRYMFSDVTNEEPFVLNNVGKVIGK